MPTQLDSAVTSFVLIFSLLVGFSASSYAESNNSGNSSNTTTVGRDTPLGADLTDYSNVVRAEGEFDVDLSMARLNYARANLVDAQAAQEWQRARLFTLLVNRLDLELLRLRQDEHKIREQSDRIQDKATELNQLNTGRTNSYVFTAFHYLEIQAIPSDVLVSAMSVAVPWLDANNFIPNRSGATPFAFDGGNVGMLLTFLEKNNYSMEPFQPAHLAVLGSLGQLADAASQKLTALQQRLSDLRNGTLDIWHVPGERQYTFPVGLPYPVQTNNGNSNNNGNNGNSNNGNPNNSTSGLRPFFH